MTDSGASSAAYLAQVQKLIPPSVAGAVKIRENPSFGTYYGFPFRDLMVVCVNDGFGWTPWRVLLPHQLYVRDVANYLREHPRVRHVGAFPLAPESYRTAWADHEMWLSKPEREALQGAL